MNNVLILSGASYMIEAVIAAKNMGLYTIVTDNAVKAPAKEFADKSYSSNASDLEQLAEIVQLEKIDGVFVAFDDMNAWHALALCKKTNLPFYTVCDQLAGYSGDFRFKEYCRSFNVPIVEQRWPEQELAKLDFPMDEPLPSLALQVV